MPYYYNNNFHIYCLTWDNTGILAGEKALYDMLHVEIESPEDLAKNTEESKLESRLSDSKLCLLSTKSLYLLISHTCRELYTFQITFIFIILFDSSKQQHEAGGTHIIVHIWQMKPLYEMMRKVATDNQTAFLYTLD